MNSAASIRLDAILNFVKQIKLEEFKIKPCYGTSNTYFAACGLTSADNLLSRILEEKERVNTISYKQ